MSNASPNSSVASAINITLSQHKDSPKHFSPRSAKSRTLRHLVEPGNELKKGHPFFDRFDDLLLHGLRVRIRAKYCRDLRVHHLQQDELKNVEWEMRRLAKKVGWNSAYVSRMIPRLSVAHQKTLTIFEAECRAKAMSQQTRRKRGDRMRVSPLAHPQNQISRRDLPVAVVKFDADSNTAAQPRVDAPTAPAANVPADSYKLLSYVPVIGLILYFAVFQPWLMFA